MSHSCLDDAKVSDATAAEDEAGDVVVISLPPDPNALIPKHECACLKCTFWPCIVQWHFCKALACQRCCKKPGPGPTWNRTFEAAVAVLRAGAGNMARSICLLRCITDPPIASIPKWFPTLPDNIGCEPNKTAPHFEDSSCCSNRSGEWYFPSDFYMDQGKPITGPCSLPARCCCIAHYPGNPEYPDYLRQTNKLRAQTPPRKARLILYFHGGAFCLCTPQTHRALLYRLVDATGAACFAVDYRRPPEHPFPTPVDDCFKTYEWLINQPLNEGGYSPNEIVFAGDSAGGGLVLAVMGKVRDMLGEEKMPAGGVMLSPWVDLTDSHSGSWTTNQELDFLPRDWGAMFANSYAGIGTDNPHTLAEVSPCRVDPVGLRPLLVEYGDSECLRDQIENWVKTAKEAGVDITATASAGMVHVFPLFYLMATTDAKKSIDDCFERIKHFVDRQDVLGKDPQDRKSLRDESCCTKCVFRFPLLPCICCIGWLLLMIHVIGIYLAVQTL